MLKPLLSKLHNKRIVLASGSKQRADILRSTNLKFEVCASNFEENLDPAKHEISDFVQKTALGKVNDVYERLQRDEVKADIIIGADTVVSHKGKIHGKPKNHSHAFEMIKELTQSNVPNYVYTGVIIKYKGKINSFTEITKVFMAHLSDEEINAYLETGEPMGKAGGYGIQGIASSFVERIEGDNNNIIGLPLCRLTMELKEILAQE